MLTEETREKRLGIFTGSENHRLMAGWNDPEPPRDLPAFDKLYPVYKAMKNAGKSKPTSITPLKALYPFINGKLADQVWRYIGWESIPQGLITYAQEKALEEYFNHDPSTDIETVHMRNGTDREVDAMSILAERLSIPGNQVTFKRTGDDQTHVVKDGMGATPDGLSYSAIELLQYGGEAKCKAALQHMQMWLMRSQRELKEKEFAHYVQCQTGMYVTDLPKWYFVMYQPYAKFEDIETHIIEVDRDEKLLTVLLDRVEVAKKIKSDFTKIIEGERDFRRDENSYFSAMAGGGLAWGDRA